LLVVFGAVGFFGWVFSPGTTVSLTPGAVTGSYSGGVTLSQFNQLTEGMSYAEAVSVLGRPGTEQSRSSLAGTTTVMYGWDGGGSIGANMNAMFQNDRLITKAQFGLR
jgi:hypothetical protein